MALKWVDVYFGVANVNVVVTLLTTSVSWAAAELTWLEETQHPLTSLWILMLCVVSVTCDRDCHDSRCRSDSAKQTYTKSLVHKTQVGSTSPGWSGPHEGPEIWAVCCSHLVPEAAKADTAHDRQEGLVMSPRPGQGGGRLLVRHS